jgi:FixJ family two-component response regulator
MGEISMPVEEERSVYVVDDDDSVRSGMAKLLLSEGYNVRTFDSAEAFLEKGVDDQIACIVLDLQMPGLSGLELQEHLLKAGKELAIVFLTAHGDIPDSVSAMKNGAIDFLQKPFVPASLFEAVARPSRQARASMPNAPRLNRYRNGSTG